MKACAVHDASAMSSVHANTKCSLLGFNVELYLIYQGLILWG